MGLQEAEILNASEDEIYESPIECALRYEILHNVLPLLLLAAKRRFKYYDHSITDAACVEKLEACLNRCVTTPITLPTLNRARAFGDLGNQLQLAVTEKPGQGRDGRSLTVHEAYSDENREKWASKKWLISMMAIEK
jgi:hypothetical protein